MHYSDSLENIDVILTIRNIQTVVTSLHIQFLIANLFNLIHRALRFENRYFQVKKDQFLAYNEMFSAFLS